MLIVDSEECVHSSTGIVCPRLCESCVFTVVRELCVHGGAIAVCSRRCENCIFRGTGAPCSRRSLAVAGFNPRWYESCVFTVRVPELAIVRFVVKDEDRGYDDFIGYYSLPFNSMQEGM